MGDCHSPHKKTKKRDLGWVGFVPRFFVCGHIFVDFLCTRADFVSTNEWKDGDIVPREIIVKFRMDEVEKAELDRLVLESGLEMSDYCRMRVLSAGGPKLPVIEVGSDKAATCGPVRAVAEGVNPKFVGDGPNGEFTGDEEMPVGRMGVKMSAEDRARMQLIAQARIKRRRAPESKE